MKVSEILKTLTDDGWLNAAAEESQTSFEDKLDKTTLGRDAPKRVP